MAAPSSSSRQQPYPLVAILFVASTASRGPQVVFRYPRKPQVVRRLSRIRYYTPHGTNKEHIALDAAEHLRDRAQWDEEGDDSGDEAAARRREGQDEEEDEADDASGSDSSTDSSYYQGDSFEDSQTSQGSDSANTTDVESASDVMSTSHTARSSNGSRARSNRLGRLTTRDADQPRSSRNHASSDSATAPQHRNTLRSPSRGPRRPPASSSLRNPGSPEPPTARRGAAAGGGGGAAAFARSQQQQHQRTNDSPARRARNAKAFSHYLGYPVDFLAEMIAPKSEMCNQRFELVVDDLAFVGHPVYKRAPEQASQQEGRGRPPPDGNQPQQEGATSSSSAPPARVEMLHLVLVIQPPDPSYATPTLDLTTWLGLWYDNVTFKMTAALWAEEQRCGYVSQQTALLSRLWGAVEGHSGASASGPSYAQHLSEVLLTSSLARSLRQMFRSLTRQNAQRTTPFVVLNDSLEVHLQLPPLLTDPARMVKSILELGPSIEADDPDVWADAVGNPLDEWTRATGPPLFPWKTLLLLNEPDGDRTAEKARRYRSIGGKVVEVASESSDDDDEDNSSDARAAHLNPADAGIEVWSRKFTSLLKPTLDGVPTFADLASLLSWDLQADVYPMARHLVYYKQAKVSDVPRIQNTYTVSPLFDAATDLQRFALSFSLRFPEQPPLARLLAVVSSSLQPFVQHFLSLQGAPQQPAEASHRGINALARRRRCLEVLIWLLRHDVILQQHLRFRLIATEAVKRRARERWERSRLKREEERRKKEEKREWRREKRALLKEGVDPMRRRGELVPLMAQSAPDALRQGGVGGAAQATVVRARLDGEREHVDVARVRGRQRQRSRSAEARERRQQQQQQQQQHDAQPSDGGDHGTAERPTQALDDGTARRAASRISSHSRSRSRNPPPLGRIGASGHLVSTAATGTRSRPGSSSGLRFESPSHNDAQQGATTLQFVRRHVSRSRSPSSAMFTSMTPAVVSPEETRGEGSADGEGLAVASASASSSGGAAAVVAGEATSTSAGTTSGTGTGTGSRHSAGAQSISSLHSASGGGSGSGSANVLAPGLSSTPREKANQILAAEQQSQQAGQQQQQQQQQQRKRAASMARVSSGSSSTGGGGGPGSSSTGHGVAPPSTSGSSGQRGRRRADSAAAAATGTASGSDTGSGGVGSGRRGGAAVVARANAVASPTRTFSRSPSQARMRVSGFGGPEEKVWVDGREVTADTDVGEAAAAVLATATGSGDEEEQESHGAQLATSLSAPSEAEDTVDVEAAQRLSLEAVQSGRRLSLVGEEDGETSPPQQRTSPAPAQSNNNFVVANDEDAKPSRDPATVQPSNPHRQAGKTGDNDGEGEAASKSSSSDESSDSSSSSSSSDSSTNPHTWDLHRPTLIPDPSRASRVENAWIDAMLSLHTRTTGATTSSSSPPSTRRRRPGSAEEEGNDSDAEEEDEEDDEDYEVRQAFFRLLPYLNGRHTIDEVVCREGMRRKQLRVLLGRFREEIMTFVHS